MNTLRLMIPVWVAVSAIASFAQSGTEPPRNAPETAPEAAEAPPRGPRHEPRLREGRQQRPDAEGRRREMWIGEGFDGPGGQSMMLRLLDNPETSARLGIQPEVRDKILASFRTIDNEIAARRTELVALQRAQAKLMADRAPEEAVMEAVDKVWKCRGEIAKLQTAKVLELQSNLTDEQIKKIDTVLAEEFRTRRMRQLRDGGAKDPRGPGQLRGDGDAPPAKAAEPPAGTEAPKGK